MIYEPANEAELAECVRAARASNMFLRVRGGGSKQDFGRPIEPPAVLSLRKLSGLVFYEPAEMTLAAKAGAPWREIADLIAAHGQMAPFEPPDWRALYKTQGEPTLGGLIAGNLSGSRRISHGAARDSLLGVRFVNGYGDIVKSGGRVVKNVTGIDLCKAQAGAWGTLGVLSEIVIKLLPRPERTATLFLAEPNARVGLAALRQALNSPYEVSGAAYLPEIAGHAAGAYLRIENFSTSVAYRLERLRGALGGGEILEDSASLWSDIGAGALCADKPGAIWRVSTAPTRAYGFIEALRRDCAFSHYYDWGGGLIWLSLEDPEASGFVRPALEPFGGHAALIRAPKSLRAHIEPLQPLSAPLAALERRLKASFDPQGLFNPGLLRAAE